MGEIRKISKEEFDKIQVELKTEQEKVIVPLFTPEEINSLSGQMDRPIDQMKEIAAKLKLYINYQIEKDMKERDLISDFTRRWIEVYNELLEKIQRSIYGDKSVSLNLHKISHADIGAMIRKYSITNKEGTKNIKIEVKDANE